MRMKDVVLKVCLWLFQATDLLLIYLVYRIASLIIVFIFVWLKMVMNISAKIRPNRLPIEPPPT